MIEEQREARVEDDRLKQEINVTSEKINEQRKKNSTKKGWLIFDFSKSDYDRSFLENFSQDLTHFSTTILVLYLLKTYEKQRFSGVFRGYKIDHWREIGLMSSCFKQVLDLRRLLTEFYEKKSGSKRSSILFTTLTKASNVVKSFLFYFITCQCYCKV